MRASVWLLAASTLVPTVLMATWSLHGHGLLGGSTGSAPAGAAAPFDPALAVIAAAGMLGFALAMMTLRRVLDPVQALAETARAVAAGDGQVRAPESGPRELVQLARDFNDMLDAKQASELALARREQAEAASRARAEFVSRMSHELRTPLNAVLGFAEVLRRDPAVREQPRALRQLDHIHRAGTHLLALISDLLDIARIESTRVPIRTRPLDLADQIEPCLELLGPAAEAAGVTLQRVPVEPDLFVLADADRLRQVLLNLVSNAIKYNHPGGRVRVTARAEGERVVITVADNGCGMSPAQLERLFRPFDRLGAEHGDVQGTGLGLVISRQLAQAMGGDVAVDSECGVGSRFALCLPRTAATRPAQVVPDAAPATELPSRPVRVLCVDDDAACRELVRAAFEAWPDCCIDAVATAAEAVAEADRHPPDLSVLDLTLPDIDGASLLQRLRARPGLATLPGIALTALAADSDRLQALAAGFDGYLVKPVHLDDLLHEAQRQLLQSPSARATAAPARARTGPAVERSQTLVTATERTLR